MNGHQVGVPCQGCGIINFRVTSSVLSVIERHGNENHLSSYFLDDLVDGGTISCEIDDCDKTNFVVDGTRITIKARHRSGRVPGRHSSVYDLEEWTQSAAVILPDGRTVKT